MKRISQRELRNENAAVMDAVEAGETLIITRRGVDVGELRPLQRPTSVPTDELRQALATLPKVDYGQMRAEADAFFGEDRIGDD